ncbi:NlpC/P60 family protein [Crocinitomicaceae bacterium]|nr:NlpC/P60 family protein [Crocinitomicaceae bacterium]MDC0257586.1 NlpC/P60 family protein [Crocinitomicaceae bacterium]
MKALIFITFLIVSTCGFGQDSLMTKSDSIVHIAESQLGIPYKYATSNPDVSFDCSGFTSYVYSSCDLPNSRSSKAYGNLGTKVSLETCQPGDCMIFSGTAAGSTTIGHVGIVVSNDESGLKFIHCSSSKRHFGVVITDYYQSNYPKRFLQVRRLF